MPRPATPGPRPGRLLSVLLAVLVLLGAGEATAQRAYHFSPTGDDDRGDGSAARPWASVGRANTLDLEPGDSLLFEGGGTFRGNLTLGADDAGTPERPVVVASYGRARAVLDAGDGLGIYVYNAGGVAVRALVVRGSGVSTNTSPGIFFYTDAPGGVKHEHVRIEDVEVYGFGEAAVIVGSWNGTSGYRDVRVTGISAHSSLSGMGTYAQEIGGIENLYVGNSQFFDNSGRSGEPNPTGSGLVVSGVRGALVERNLAWGNGAENTNSAGPVGIWAYEADSVVIRHNESWANRTRGGDGGGFDLDGGVTNSVLEYNYSHDNDGAGFGLFQNAGAGPSGGNTVRYNVSENDGRKNGYGAISVWGASPADPVGSADVYHNTVFVGPAASGKPSAVELKNGNHRGLTLRNNVLVTAGGVALVKGPASRDARFEGNAYWTGGAPFAVRWGGTTYRSLEAWRSATGQERVGGEAVGTVADPGLQAAGAGGTLGDPDRLHALEAYRLRPDSPLAAAALDLAGRFGVAPGPTDFYGTRLGPGGGRAVGAHEPSAVDENTVMTAQGPVERVDAGAGRIDVAGVQFALTDETEVTDDAGAPVDPAALEVGWVVDVVGTALPDGRLQADRVGVRARTSTSAEGAAPLAAPAVTAVFPNPTSARAAVAVALPEPAVVEVAVYDTLGRVVLRLPARALGAGAGRIDLDVAGLPAGLYRLRVTAQTSGGVVATWGSVTVAR